MTNLNQTKEKGMSEVSISINVLENNADKVFIEFSAFESPSEVTHPDGSIDSLPLSGMAVVLINDTLQLVPLDYTQSQVLHKDLTQDHIERKKDFETHKQEFEKTKPFSDLVKNLGTVACL